MPRKGHTEEQVVTALQQVESGAKVAQVCRKTGIEPFRRNQIHKSSCS